MWYGVKMGMKNISWTIEPKCHLARWSITCTSQIQTHNELFNMLCTPWGPVIGLHLKNVTKGNHRLFADGAYELLEVMCFGLVDLIKWSFIKESWCYSVWNLNNIVLFIEHNWKFTSLGSLALVLQFSLCTC